MPKESKFDEEKFRNMVKSGATAVEICADFGIQKPTLKNFKLKLMEIDKTYYDIPGMDERIVTPKVNKNGLLISSSKMKAFGYDQGQEVIISKTEDGKIIIEKKI